jgi:cyclopropane fatty-acyl-phospholipid synthase-like methyltransferase
MALSKKVQKASNTGASEAVTATAMKTNDKWNFEGDSAFHALGVHGLTEGLSPELEVVAKNRHDRADHIHGLMKFDRDDIVLDMGSGMGFMAERIAPKVKKLHCADISESFLAMCKSRTARNANVETHLISYADLKALKGKGINKVYSALLFIHFNFYDFTFYLKELHEVLEPGGMLFFDYNDGDTYVYDNEKDSFIEHLKIYREVRIEWIFGCMHMCSTATLRNILPQIGFEIISHRPSTDYCFTEMIVRKV